MKRIGSAVLAAAIGSLGLAGNAWAEGSTASGTPLDRWQEGQVQSVDTAAGRITFGTGQAAETNPHTLVVKDGQPASLSDIQPGDDVRAAFLPNDPFHPARIEVTSQRDHHERADVRPGQLPAWYQGEHSGAPASPAASTGEQGAVEVVPTRYPAGYYGEQ